MNPYVAGGWGNPENPNSMNRPSYYTPAFRQPSIFGALPSLGITASIGSLKFRFRSHIPDIRNSTLCAPNGSDCLEIVTNQHITYFRKKDETVMATIDWSGHPRVTISGFIEDVEIRRWLPGQPDGRRMMFAPGPDEKPFTWVYEPRQISLYAVGSIVMKGVLGHITTSAQSVTLNITSDAIQAGLLESAIVATVILQSGRPFD